MMILTNDDIREDIKGFNQRIQTAREKLAELPTGRLPFKQHKRREQKRRELEADIKQIQTLLSYAMEALREYA